MSSPPHSLDGERGPLSDAERPSPQRQKPQIALRNRQPAQLIDVEGNSRRAGREVIRRITKDHGPRLEGGKPGAWRSPDALSGGAKVIIGTREAVFKANDARSAATAKS